MTKRYPLGSAFGGGDSGDAGDLERVALGRSAPAHLLERQRAYAHKSVRGGLAHRSGLGADIHHRHFRALAEMGEFFHSRPRRGSTKAISPASQLSFSGGTTRNALDSAMATTSPEPCHGRAETSGSPRTLCTRSYLPMETPPEMMRRFTSKPRSMRRRSSFSSSGAFPKDSVSAPVKLARVSSAMLLPLRTCNGPGVAETSTTSSPVERMAAR